MPKVSERGDWRPLPEVYERGMTKVYFIDKCPMSDQCTKSFKDAKVWAYTQTGCREQLAKHYINSGNHEMGEEEQWMLPPRSRFNTAQLVTRSPVYSTLHRC